MSWVGPSSSASPSSFPSSGGWVGPGGGGGSKKNGKKPQQRRTNTNKKSVAAASTSGNPIAGTTYRALVVDSGPIIRHTGLSSLYGKADHYFTVPAVLQEIRDARARSHLESLPFELQSREPSKESIHAVIEFSKLTGDYQSLSTVDLQVLALVYELEKEGCATQLGFSNMNHIRKTPKRTVGIGKIQALNKDSKQEDTQEGKAGEEEKASNENETKINGLSFFESEIEIVDGDGDDEADECDEGSEDDEEEKTEEDAPKAPAPTLAQPTGPRSWAMLVNPTSASRVLPKVPADISTPLANTLDVSDDRVLGVSFGSMNLLGNTENTTMTANDQADDAGQFSDADEGDDAQEQTPTKAEDESKAQELQAELQSDFPSLQAALTVPYEGSDTEDDHEAGNESQARKDANKDVVVLGMTKEEQEKRKQESLKPVSKSGKLYNSFRKYGDLMKPKPPTQPKQDKNKLESAALPEAPIAEDTVEQSPQQHQEPTTKKPANESRIIGGVTMSGQEMEVEDDGEGWITCTRDIHAMKSAGALDPSRTPADALSANKNKKEPVGPPNSIRAACTTTDFAMQNVILQMNLELLSVDGIKIRRLKSWVTRCGACFKIYADGDSSSTSGNANTGGKRLFCSHCGSDFMQRIAASVDSKTGRLRLHMSKKHKNNLRGTKYSLPKAGTGNRFQGDLLLREDQLMMGAWNQKVKIRSGGKSREAAQSIFGKDLASNVGCNPKLIHTSGDIQVGFGRRNPNSAKGRERRGKKKKSSDRACGLHRY